MRKEQILKLLKVAVVTTAIMLLFEIIFSIPAVIGLFQRIIYNTDAAYVYIIIGIIMFLQVTILNIPAYVILSACSSIGLQLLDYKFICTVWVSYMFGCMFAYWLGKKFGKRAVKWCAGSEEDYYKWSEILNKKGKWLYAASVLLPLFPDDLLCLCAGAVNFNQSFYILANVVGRLIGLVAMILTLQVINIAGGGFPFMILVWAAALITEIILYILIKKDKVRFNMKNYFMIKAIPLNKKKKCGKCGKQGVEVILKLCIDNQKDKQEVCDACCQEYMKTLLEEFNKDNEKVEVNNNEN